MQVKLSLSDVQLTQIPSHPNKMLWTGIATRLGIPSNAPPCGTNGKLLVISPEAASKAAPSMINMPLNCEWPDDMWYGSCPESAMTGHDFDNIIGTVVSTEIAGNAFICSGIIWKQNFPDVAFMINNAVESLGFSIEADINSSTEDETTVTATDITFTGLATLWKKCAAWESTEFKQLVASRSKQEKEVDKMTKEEMQSIIDAMFKNMDEKITKLEASIDEKVSEIETKVTEVKAETEKANKQVEDLAVGVAEIKVKADEEVKIKAEAEEKAKKEAEEKVKIEAAAQKKPPAPTVLANGQTVIPNTDFDGVKKTKKERIAEVWASNDDMKEKMRKVVRINAETEESK